MVKALSWKIIATTLTMFITYYFTGELGESLRIGGAVFVLGIILFYIHERIWNHIHWGKFRKNNSND